MHKCAAVYRETIPVHEVFRGQIVWQSRVEVIDMTGHPEAKRAYAWSHRKDRPTRRAVRSLLEIPTASKTRCAMLRPAEQLRIRCNFSLEILLTGFP